MHDNTPQIVVGTILNAISIVILGIFMFLISSANNGRFARLEDMDKIIAPRVFLNDYRITQLEATTRPASNPK